MPDDRLIHRAFGHSEKVNKLTSGERDVWLVYKLAADDFGVMRYSATPLQDAALWLERQPSKQILRALDVVRNVGLIATFEHQGQPYVFDPVWQSWQKITHPRQTKQPAPPTDALDVHTRWLFTHHPKGGKLKSWQAPTEKKPGADREDTGSKPEVLPVQTSPVFVGNGGVRVRGSGGAAGADAGSKRPVYVSDRFAVFEWQFTELSKTLGPHFEAFGLDEFFDALTQQSRRAGLVIPRDKAWDWLQSEVLTEAKRRGLPMASSVEGPSDRKARERAQDERILADIQQERAVRAVR